MFKKIKLVISMLVAITFIAEPGRAASDGASADKNVGVYASIFGDSTLPYGSLNFAYEPTPTLRFSLGAGISIGYTVGIGAKYLFTPHLGLSPFLGANASVLYTNFASGFTGAIEKVFNANSNRTSVYEFFGYLGASAGIDWKTVSGFNLAVGANLWASAQGQLNLSIVPFANVGYFF